TCWAPSSARVAIARFFSRQSKSDISLGPQQNRAKLPDVARAGTDLLALYQLNYALFLPDFWRELLIAPPNLHDGLPARAHEWLEDEICDHRAIEAAAILETRCFV